MNGHELADAKAHGGDIETLAMIDAGCRVCAAPLFTWEQPVGLCRMHGLAGTESHAGVTLPSGEQEPDYRTDRLRSLMILGSINPPIPERGQSVRWVRQVLQPTEEELRQFVASQQTLTPAMRKIGDTFTGKGCGIDPVTRKSDGTDRQFRIVST